MNFSFEEIYYMYGQFDALVRVYFSLGSEPSEKYRSNLLGEFIYTLEDRTSCEESLKLNPVPRTNRFIRFKPSSVEDVTKEEIEDLERYGFECKDVISISSYDRERENRFMRAEVKEIPGTVNINLESSYDLKLGILGSLLMRMNSGDKFLDQELYKFYGYMLYYHEDQIAGKIPDLFIDEASGKCNDQIRNYFLEAKLSREHLSETELNEYQEILSKHQSENLKILIKEFQKSDPNWKKNVKKYGDSFWTLVYWARDFRDQALCHCSIIIWWDFERFVHISMRHVKEMQMGEYFIKKTSFQYSYKDFFRLIGIVLEDLSKEIDEHFSSRPNDIFKRMGKRAHYYDGTFYRVEIEPSGRLLTFHPLNNEQQKLTNQ